MKVELGWKLGDKKRAKEFLIIQRNLTHIPWVTQSYEPGLWTCLLSKRREKPQQQFCFAVFLLFSIPHLPVLQGLLFITRPLNCHTTWQHFFGGNVNTSCSCFWFLHCLHSCVVQLFKWCHFQAGMRFWYVNLRRLYSTMVIAQDKIFRDIFINKLVWIEYSWRKEDQIES